jgi:hypothetical protein
MSMTVVGPGDVDFWGLVSSGGTESGGVYISTGVSVGEEREGKEMDGCPLTITLAYHLPTYPIVTSPTPTLQL